MLEIKVNIVPFGIVEAKRELFDIQIWNKGDGSNEIGNYGYKITDNRTLEIKGDFDNFKRKRGSLSLLKEILTKEGM
jgi:hypothetical protein